MLEYLVRLNWQAIWQSLVVFIIASVIARTLRDCEDEDRSFHRLVVWGFAALSPLLLVPLTATAAYLNWNHYNALLVWRWFLPSDGNIPATAITPVIQNKATILVVIDRAYFFWLIGYGLYSLYEFIRGCLWIHRTRHYIWKNPGEEQAFREVCAQYGFKKPPILLEIDSNTGPHVYGWWRPCVILPCLLFSPIGTSEEFRAVVSHECAHIKYWHNTVQLLLWIVTWLFPLSRLSLWQANRNLEHEMDLFSDAAAVQIGGADKKILKDVLKKFAGEEIRPPLSQLLEFAKPVAQRLTRPLGRPLFKVVPFASRIPFLPMMCVVASQLNFSIQLGAVALTPSIMPSLRVVTDTIPISFATPVKIYHVKPMIYHKVEPLISLAFEPAKVYRVEPVIEMKVAEPLIVGELKPLSIAVEPVKVYYLAVEEVPALDTFTDTPPARHQDNPPPDWETPKSVELKPSSQPVRPAKTYDDSPQG